MYIPLNKSVQQDLLDEAIPILITYNVKDTSYASNPVKSLWTFRKDLLHIEEVADNTPAKSDANGKHLTWLLKKEK